MPDNTDNQTSSNPQAAVDAALNGTALEAVPTTSTTTETTTVAPAATTVPPTQFEAAPAEAPAPTTTTTTTTAAPLDVPAAPALTEPAAPLKTETTTTTTTPLTLPAPETPAPSESTPPASSAPMGDETPLAFVTPLPTSTTTTTTTTAPVTPDPVQQSSYVTTPPVPPTSPVVPVEPKKGSSAKKTIGVVLGAFLLLAAVSIGGLFAYQYFGTGETPSIAYVTKFINVGGKTVKNPDYEKAGEANKQEREKELTGGNVSTTAAKGTTKESCSGCRNGGWQVWRNGECKITGICGSGVPGKDTDDPMQDDIELMYNSRDKCNGSGKGYVWCESTDSSGKKYAFCNIKGVGCNQAAIDKGYSIQIGIVKCKCRTTDAKTGACTGGYTTDNSTGTYNNSTAEVKAEVERQCNAQVMGTGSFLCKVGVKGYSGNAACTSLNGVPFKGNLGCFCGTVQVDTGTGHTSYTSSCGCNENETTTTTTPTMSCTGLTRSPATASPAVGTKLTFTCAGVVTPASAGTLNYKFRYSLNSGAYQTLANKTATTAELTLAACGSYSVQCQACTTLNGVLTCNPTWTGATQ